VRNSIVIAIFGVSVLTAGIASADVLKLRGSCAGETGNCFTGVASLLAEIHAPSLPGRSVPSAANPVLVDIGPGVFTLGSTSTRYCDGVSNLTFRGAGARATVLDGGGSPWSRNGANFAVAIRSCSGVEFSDLTIRGISSSVEGGILFEGNGFSRWIDVDVQANRIGWWDEGASSVTSARHDWWNCQLAVAPSPTTSSTAWTMYVSGSTHYIYASRISMDVANAGSTVILPTALYLYAASSDVHVYGSAISASDSRTAGWVSAIWVGYFDPQPESGQTLSAEGNNITAVATGPGGQAYALITGAGSATNGSKAFVRGTRFVASAPGGTAVRVASVHSTATIDAPYELGSGSNPPAVSTAWSIKGQDTFVETDCSATRCDGNTTPALGTSSHVLIFDPACGGPLPHQGPWFDTVSQKCRGL
jgi:hypothetical protein